MRIVQFFIVCFVACNFTARAQRTNLVGMKVGSSMSTFTGYKNADFLYTPAFGVFANIPVSDKFGVQTGLDASFIGWYISKYNWESVPITSLQLFVKYYPVGGLNAQFGGELLRLGGVGMNSYHEFNSGLCAGLGYDFPKLQLYARYFYGITNLNAMRNDWYGSVFLDHTEKSRVLQIGLEFRLIKKKEKGKQYFGKYARPQ